MCRAAVSTGRRFSGCCTGQPEHKCQPSPNSIYTNAIYTIPPPHPPFTSPPSFTSPFIPFTSPTLHSPTPSSPSPHLPITSPTPFTSPPLHPVLLAYPLHPTPLTLPLHLTHRFTAGIQQSPDTKVVVCVHHVYAN